MTATLAPSPRVPPPRLPSPRSVPPAAQRRPAPAFHRDRPTFMTRAEWAVFEETSPHPHEWLGTQPPGAIDDDAVGEVRPVQGYKSNGEPAVATRNHSAIAMNVSGHLWAKLADTPYEVHSQGLAVRDPLGPYHYPDVLISPYPGTFEPHPDGDELYLTDPLVVIEVLSDSTADSDRTRKRAAYLRMPTVTDYLLVEQDRPFVTHLRKIRDPAGDRWDGATADTAADGPAAAATLAAPPVSLPLEAVYRRVL